MNTDWNTWDSVYPAQMTYLPLGLTVTPCAYAASTGTFTAFPATAPGLQLWERAIDGSWVSLHLQHAGSELDLRYDKPSPDVLRGGWRAGKLAEWGLRVWVIVVFEAGDTEWRYDPESGRLSAEIDGRPITVTGQAPPLMATFHDSIAALEAELKQHGYFYLASRGTRGRVAALRYNLEEMPRFSFSVTVGGAPLPIQKAVQPKPLQSGFAAAPLDALRDLVGWNTVFDAINRRRYMSLSRNWVAQKFGGFGVWLDDLFYHALMSALFDPTLARDCIKAVLATETPEGNFACLITGNDRWIDRSQPPICSFILWKIWQHTGDDSLVDLAYDRLLVNHDWWFSRRDGNQDGLMAWGTSPVGDGLYMRTKLGAKNESSMDNSPIHDEAQYDPKSGCLDQADVGLNSLIALDGEILARFARGRGDAKTAERLESRAAALRRRIEERLWDPARGIFANRRWNGNFIRSLAPTSFYPMLAGAATEAQQGSLLKWLDDPRAFGGVHRLPSVTRDDPAYHDNVYWRGRVWPPLNYLTYGGLKRCGHLAEATVLAGDSVKLFAAAWAKRQMPENFSAETGQADDQVDTDLFYGWGGLMPLIGINEIIDVTPWDGWEINPRPDRAEGDWRLGPLLAFGRKAELVSEGGWLTLTLDAQPVLRTDIATRLTQIEIRPDGTDLDTRGGGTMVLSAQATGELRSAKFDGRDIAMTRGEVTLPAMHQARRLQLRWK
ncbi:trehalase family glycosidase [Dongia sp.]|uniref:MGH1-like glycoside hydrolase domain-containing protein n=1 Tax=Dongia sp. TaxID=1977262 RepID=UPI00375185A6